MFSLAGWKLRVIGSAHEHSIAWGRAKPVRAQGADLAVNWLKDKVEPQARPLARELGARIAAPPDVAQPGQIEAPFDRIAARKGRIDTVVHSAAFASKDEWHGHAVDCRAGGLAPAMEIWAHSFLRLIRLTEPLMPQGGTCLPVSLAAASPVLRHHDMMGLLKAPGREPPSAMSLPDRPKRASACTRSRPGRRPPGSLRPSTLSARCWRLHPRAQTRQLATIEDAGARVAFLASPEARNLTGDARDIDGRYSATA